MFTDKTRRIAPSISTDRQDNYPPRFASGTIRKSEVAALTLQDLHGMEEGELVEVIRAGMCEFQDRQIGEELPQQSRETLEKLARQVRHSCRQQGY